MKRLFTIVTILGLGSMMTAQTPELLKDIKPGGGDGIGFYLHKYMAEYDGKLFFTADDGTHGKELWATDGTEAGTALIKDINAGPVGSDCRKFYPSQGYLFFLATDEEHGEELWRTDGTSSGTQLVKDILPGPSGGIYTDVGLETDHYVWNDILYFGAKEGEHGYEVWRSDGTEAGTWMLKDIWEGPGSSFPRYFVEHEGRLYFSADGLWSTDGTEAGTTGISSIIPYNTVSCNGSLFFVGRSGPNNYELWRSDGTGAGTAMVKEINPSGSSIGCTYGEEQELVPLGDVVYFSADDGTGIELWRSDGTEGGTYMVREASSNDPNSCAKPFAVLDGVLYYGFNDGEHGYEFWRSDGTEEGTWMVKDLISGSSGSFSHVRSFNMAAIGDKLFFGAGYESSSELELWQSDGTQGGTTLVADLQVGSGGSDPQYFHMLGDDLIFVAESFHAGYELWKMSLTTGTGDKPWPEPAFKVAPSLTNGPFSILFSENTHPVAFDVTLSGLTGAALKTWTGASSGQWLDAGELPAGIYFVRVSEENVSLGVKKMVLIR